MLHSAEKMQPVSAASHKCNLMEKKNLKRYLFKSSFRLYLFYMITSIMIISIYDSSNWSSIMVRALTVTLSSLVIFVINIGIIAFYKDPGQKSTGVKNTEKRIFATGFLCTFLLSILHYFISTLLIRWGIDLHLPKNLLVTGGAKTALILFCTSAIQYTFIYMIQMFVLSQHEKSNFELELLKLKSSNAETANQLLQQQIKPHFLFNALTTLKSLIRKKPDTAETYLVQLSDFLRASFVHTDTNSGLTPIAEELKICHNYMEMQKVRFGHALHYSVDPSLMHCAADLSIPTFSLQPLLENAIKHNIVTAENPLYIEIVKSEDWIKVSNNLQPKTSMNYSTGKGIANLKERYSIISGDQVKVERGENTFSVRIKILGS